MLSITLCLSKRFHKRTFRGKFMARQLHRELSNSHIQLIAIGGAIGLGYF